MIYIDINENLDLLENIPADLRKAYADASITGYDSHKRAGDTHRELAKANSTDGATNGSGRKFATYDYGKATYTPISAEEAIRLVKANSEDIEKLRIIFGGKLVEFELRNNGKLYTVYRDANTPYDIDGTHYKNVGYMPWRKVLQYADKIYLTDEYDHLIDRSEGDSDSIHLMGAVDTKADNYDVHLPAMNFSDNISFGHQNFDTGKHVVRYNQKTNRLDTHAKYAYNAYSNSSLDSDSLEFADYYDRHRQSGRSSISSKYNQYFEDYNNLLIEKEKAYIQYNAARKAYQKLLRDREDYTPEEFEKLEVRYAEAKKRMLANYEDVAKRTANMKSKVVVAVNKEAIKANRRIADYVKTLESALTQTYELRKQLEALKLRSYELGADANAQKSYRFRVLENDLANTISSMESAKSELERYQAQEDASPVTVRELESTLRSRVEQLADIRTALDAYRVEAINNGIAKIKELETKLTEVDAEVARIRPRWAAKKQQNDERNQGKLDPRLENIIDFTDFD